MIGSVWCSSGGSSRVEWVGTSTSGEAAASRERAAEGATVTVSEKRGTLDGTGGGCYNAHATRQGPSHFSARW